MYHVDWMIEMVLSQRSYKYDTKSMCHMVRMFDGA